MVVLARLFQLVVAMLLAMAFAFALFWSTTALGQPLGPAETGVMWIGTILLGWVTFRYWSRVRRSS